MEDLQKTIKSLTEENQRLNKEQGELRNKVTSMEKERKSLNSKAALRKKKRLSRETMSLSLG
nr:unnamed protein product [Callosobruchus analis]